MAKLSRLFLFIVALSLTAREAPVVEREANVYGGKHDSIAKAQEFATYAARTSPGGEHFVVEAVVLVKSVVAPPVTTFLK